MYNESNSSESNIVKKELKQIEESIEYWKGIVEQYPKATQYKEIVDMLVRDRVRLVNKIHRK